MFLKNLPKEGWYGLTTIGCCLVLPVSIAGAITLVNSSSFSLVKGDLKVEAKKALNNKEYSDRRYDEERRQFEQKIYKLEPKNSPIIEAYEEFKPTIDANVENSEKVEEFVEQAIKKK